MFSLIPTSWKWIGGTVIVAGLWIGHNMAVSSSYFDGVAAAQTAQKNRENLALITANAKIKFLQSKLDLTEETMQQKLYDQKAENEKSFEKYAASYRAGTERLQCPRTVAANPAPANSGNTAPAAGIVGSETTYLVPEASVDVLRLAADSAKDVLEYNTVVKLYNLMRATCNGQ